MNAPPPATNNDPGSPIRLDYQPDPAIRGDLALIARICGFVLLPAFFVVTGILWCIASWLTGNGLAVTADGFIRFVFAGIAWSAGIFGFLAWFATGRQWRLHDEGVTILWNKRPPRRFQWTEIKAIRAHRYSVSFLAEKKMQILFGISRKDAIRIATDMQQRGDAYTSAN